MVRQLIPHNSNTENEKPSDRFSDERKFFCNNTSVQDSFILSVLATMRKKARLTAAPLTANLLQTGGLKMITVLRHDAETIIQRTLRAVQPDESVRSALKNFHPSGRVILVAVGKAAWQMAKTAVDNLGNVLSGGVVITKYGHIKGSIPNVTCYEAGHPIPDENSFFATERAIQAIQGLTMHDTVLFLLSGGGSALFEKPLISGKELQDITSQLLSRGADIVEMNIIRKRLSSVKGGRFAQLCAPAHVFSIVLSDILNDPLDMIASGPAYPDQSTAEQAMEIVRKYKLDLSEKAMEFLEKETPKSLNNVETHIAGSIRELVKATAISCRQLGYEPVVLTDCLCCEAKEAGSFLASIARSHANDGKALAFLAGGETVVHLKGKGKGGRNQELALAAANGIHGCNNLVIFSIGSDGTDGPTDAAGGIVDGTTKDKLEKQGLHIYQILEENDAYHALRSVNSLVFTGATGTNVNDISVILIR